MGDVPFERQHDADAGYEADAVTALARASGILMARGQFAHAQGRPEQEERGHRGHDRPVGRRAARPGGSEPDPVRHDCTVIVTCTKSRGSNGA